MRFTEAGYLDERPDPLQLSETGNPAPSKPWVLRRSLLLYVLILGTIAAVEYLLDWTTIVVAFVGILAFAAGYWAGWRDCERGTGT